MTTFGEKLESLPWALGLLIAVAVSVGFAVAGILVVRRLVSHKTLKAHHDVAGFVFTNLGVLYGVLLGFTVVNVQQRFDSIGQTAEVEASYLSQLFRDAEVLSDTDRKTIRQAIHDYTDSVVHDEWDRMANGEVSPGTQQALKRIWAAYYAVELKTRKQEIWYSESVSKLNLLMGVRLQRLMGGSEFVGAETWVLLIAGGTVMIAFIWFFGLESLTSHILMASVLAASTAFLLFLIYSLDTAYSGKVSVPPEAFVRVLDFFQLGKSNG